MKKNMNLGNLRVMFTHHNVAKDANVLRSYTECRITPKDSEKLIAEGKSMVHRGDMFCKETGRKLALTHALRQTGLSKDEKKQVWEDYRTSKPKPRW